MDDLPEIDLGDPAVVADPFTAHGAARERAPLARVIAPGYGRFSVATRHASARAVLSDPRLAISTASFVGIPGVPDHCRPYLRTMSERDGPEHARLRRLVAPAFTPRRVEELRPQIERIVDGLLDGLVAHADGGPVDLFALVAQPLPMEVICALVGVPEADRPRWRGYGAALAHGDIAALAAAIPAIIDDARAALARRREEPGEDLLSVLAGSATGRDGDPDRLDGTEVVTLVWHLVLAGQTPATFITNAVVTLLEHPEVLRELRTDPSRMRTAVEELLRLSAPQLMATPRFATEDLEVDGVAVARGEALTASLAGANRDPRAFPHPESLDLHRPDAGSGHLAFGHGPHFCLGAALARLQSEVALTALLRRCPNLALAGPVQRIPDAGSWRVEELWITGVGRPPQP